MQDGKPQDFNLAEHVLAAGLEAPDKLALAVVSATGADRWSHARLRAAVLGAATGLLDRGLRPGDRVLLRIGNEPAFPVAYLACIAAGLIPVPTSAMLTGREVTKMAADIQPALVIAGDGIALPEGTTNVLPADQLAAMTALPSADFDRGDADRLAYIVYTSGTSGNPRAVMHAHRAILARRLMFEGWYGLQPSDRLLHAGAFNWTFTLGTGLMDPWTAGATALIPAEGTAIEQIPLIARRHGATLIAAAPGVFRRMLRADWAPLPDLRHGLTAGERLDPELRRAWKDRTGTDLHEAMGMSECSTFLSGSPAHHAPEGSAGYPQPGRRVAILSDDGEPLPPGQSGILAVHRTDPGLFLGYLGQPEETAERFQGDWFLTGDLAVQAEDGAISTLGRADDMMNAGGFRVAPAEVEDVLVPVPGAGDVAVTELPVPGASIIAAFWTGPATPEAMRAAGEAGLARYKQPREFIRVEALPRTPTGKINRRALREAHRKDA
ncbi:class I adenylate-forming enzyme family protein [Paracoccus sp. MC1862]|uniref:class I adenylate-forming enzyme family protein n=1 Tax=Paracoccus sp. MC1862 TaxID=2760307 RepID=UPI001601BC17|nr:class I adenylate-forming enzyme family protein [Paracoccus sp. MC1862]MBB1499171.1 acyl--CoA ligase [Paracoccus sp. MC1862]QQO45792.1 acyl--CoA ligase [Paracoccus sp. MC1862]